MLSSSARRLAAMGSLFWLLALVSVFSLDGPVARYGLSHIPGDLQRVVWLSEVFAHGSGIAMILLVVWALDRERRFFVLRAALLAFLPGIVARMGKWLVARQRPMVFDLDKVASASFIGIPGDPRDWELQSFPSGHTATAVGFAIALSYLYPRGRCLFALFAFLAASQRVLFDAHFLSDALVSAGIACFVAAILGDRLLWDARTLVKP